MRELKIMMYIIHVLNKYLYRINLKIPFSNMNAFGQISSIHIITYFSIPSYNSVHCFLFRFLKVVDKFNFQLVSAYVTQGGKTFLLLHNGKSEDAVRAFFTEVHELYVKFLMNPFYNYDASNEVVDAPIISPYFDSQVRTFAKKLLL